MAKSRAIVAKEPTDFLMHFCEITKAISMKSFAMCAWSACSFRAGIGVARLRSARK